MESVSPRMKLQDLVAYAIGYAFWFVGAAIGLVAIFQARNALNTIWPVFGDSNQWRWLLRPIDRFGLLFLGLVWLVYVIFMEHYYRESITLLRMKRDGLHTTASIETVPQNGVMRFLRRLGLDVLMWRIVKTIIPIIAFLGLAYLIQQLAFWLLTVVH